MRIFISTVLLLFCISNASAQEIWRATLVEAPIVPDEIVTETRETAPDGIPGALITTSATGDIVKAWYASPTTRYRHGILADAIEGGMLKIQTPRGRTISLSLPRSEVFEDIAPRITDLDGDGENEVITIRSSTLEGASVTIYALSGNALILRATTGFYGKKNRWLNIAGIDNFMGNRTPEIAFVSTPHIGGNLFIYKFIKRTLFKIDAMAGFSNHVIGSNELRLSAVADVNGNNQIDLALPSSDRKHLRIMEFSQGRLKEIGTASLPSAIDKAIAVVGTGAKTIFTLGLEDGTVYEVRR